MKKETKYTQKSGIPFELANYSWALEMWLTYSGILHWRKFISLSEQVLIANGFLVRDRTLYPHLLHAGILSGLNFCRFCACYHSLFEFICASTPLGLKDVASLELSTTSNSYNLYPSYPFLSCVLFPPLCLFTLFCFLSSSILSRKLLFIAYYVSSTS